MIGGDLLCHYLYLLGVRDVFGMPGTQTVPLFESLRTSKLRTVLSTQELAASLMANGHYRASGRIGVFTTIPGPGFTYAITGLAEACQDSAAIMHLVVATEDDPSRSYQLHLLDHDAMVTPIVKQIVTISDIDDLAPRLSEAYYTATAHEPGPVLVELSPRLFSQDGEPDPSFPSPEVFAVQQPTAGDIESMVKLLDQAEYPAIVIGQGAAASAALVRELIESRSIPVIANCSGRGIIAEDHPLHVCSDFSGWGVRDVNAFLDQADLILVLGCKLTHNGSSGYRLQLSKEKLVRVDTSAGVLAANYPARLAVQADIGETITALLPRLSSEADTRWTADALDDWRRRCADSRRESITYAPTIIDTEPDDLAALFTELRALLPADSCVVTDSGQHQILTRRLFTVTNPRGLIVPSDFQSMGFGLPAAIGAGIADPNRRVVLVIGDGGLLISGMELLTAVQQQLDLTILLFSDGALGQIRYQQVVSFGHSHSVELPEVDFAGLAESVGASYLLLSGKLRDGLEEALNTPGVVIVEIPLKDSKSFARRRIRRKVRRRVGNLLGRKRTSFIKRLLQRISG